MKRRDRTRSAAGESVRVDSSDTTNREIYWSEITSTLLVCDQASWWVQGAAGTMNNFDGFFTHTAAIRHSIYTIALLRATDIIRVHL